MAAELTRLGWPMTGEVCHERFLGLNLAATVPLIEAELGRKLPDSDGADLQAEGAVPLRILFDLLGLICRRCCAPLWR